MLKPSFLLLISTLVFFSFSLPGKENATQAINTSNTKYLYKIGNGTDRPINFFLSADSLKWEQLTVEVGYQSKEYYDFPKMYFKVYTKSNLFVTYKINGNETYKIYFNRAIKKFDLVYFLPYLISY